MSKTANPTAIRPGEVYVRDLGGGVRLEAEVSPCVFLHGANPLQVHVTLKGEAGTPLGNALAVDRTLPAETATEHDVSRLLWAVRTIPCRHCSRPTFDPETIEAYWDGLCERCFLAAVDAELAEVEQSEDEQLAHRDRRMKAEGMSVRVTARIHPPAGGDDYLADWYFPFRPPSAFIRSLLRRQGSAVLDDFEVITL